MSIKKVTSKEAQGLIGATNWSRLKTMTDQQIERAASSDIKTRPLQPGELKQFKRKRIFPL